MAVKAAQRDKNKPTKTSRAKKDKKKKKKKSDARRDLHKQRPLVRATLPYTSSSGVKHVSSANVSAGHGTGGANIAPGRSKRLEQQKSRTKGTRVTVNEGPGIKFSSGDSQATHASLQSQTVSQNTMFADNELREARGRRQVLAQQPTLELAHPTILKARAAAAATIMPFNRGRGKFLVSDIPDAQMKFIADRTGFTGLKEDFKQMQRTVKKHGKQIEQVFGKVAKNAEYTRKGFAAVNMRITEHGKRSLDQIKRYTDGLSVRLVNEGKLNTQREKDLKRLIGKVSTERKKETTELRGHLKALAKAQGKSFDELAKLKEAQESLKKKGMHHSMEPSALRDMLATKAGEIRDRVLADVLKATNHKEKSSSSTMSPEIAETLGGLQARLAFLDDAHSNMHKRLDAEQRKRRTNEQHVTAMQNSMTNLEEQFKHFKTNYEGIPEQIRTHPMITAMNTKLEELNSRHSFQHPHMHVVADALENIGENNQPITEQVKQDTRNASTLAEERDKETRNVKRPKGSKTMYDYFVLQQKLDPYFKGQRATEQTTTETSSTTDSTQDNQVGQEVQEEHERRLPRLSPEETSALKGKLGQPGKTPHTYGDAVEKFDSTPMKRHHTQRANWVEQFRMNQQIGKRQQQANERAEQQQREETQQRRRENFQRIAAPIMAQTQQLRREADSANRRDYKRDGQTSESVQGNERREKRTTAPYSSSGPSFQQNISPEEQRLAYTNQRDSLRKAQLRAYPALARETPIPFTRPEPVTSTNPKRRSRAERQAARSAATQERIEREKLESSGVMIQGEDWSRTRLRHAQAMQLGREMMTSVENMLSKQGSVGPTPTVDTREQARDKRDVEKMFRDAPQPEMDDDDDE